MIFSSIVNLNKHFLVTIMQANNRNKKDRIQKAYK
jgi:hypothetical protein